jgi:3-hydroxyacyl-[acyl-carrier-protein] dehydratase
LSRFAANIMETRFIGGDHILTLKLVPESPVFEGHFPGDPVLAGVVQIHWAIIHAVDLFGPFGKFKGMEQVKFFSLIRPGDPLELRLSYDSEKSRLKFEYSSEAVPKSSGFIVFGKLK